MTPPSHARGVVSITVVTHNRGHRIEELLGRLFSQFGRDEIEILIFDDASTDATPEICARYGSRIRYTRVDRKVGLIEGRRRLIRCATGRYIVQLDDDSFFPDAAALEIIRDVFEGDAACAAIAANVVDDRGGGAGTDSGPSFEVPFFPGCGVAFRADVVQRLDSYPSCLEWYGAEETALSLRLIDGGYRIVAAPALRVIHERDPGERPQAQRRSQSLVNELAIVWNYYPAALLLPFTIQKLASHSLWNLRHSEPLPLAAAAAALPKLLRALRATRSPVRWATIRRFYELRRRADQPRPVTSEERSPRAAPGDVLTRQ